MDNSQTNSIVEECNSCVQPMNKQLTNEMNEKQVDLISSPQSTSESEQAMEKYVEKPASVEVCGNDTLTESPTITKHVENVGTDTCTETSPTNNTSTENVNTEDDNYKKTETIKSLTQELDLLKIKYKETLTNLKTVRRDLRTVKRDLDMEVGEKNRYKNLWQSKKNDRATCPSARNITRLNFMKNFEKQLDKHDDMKYEIQLLKEERNNLKLQNKTLVAQLAQKNSAQSIGDNLATALRNAAVNMMTSSGSTLNSTIAQNKKKATTPIGITQTKKNNSPTPANSAPKKKNAPAPDNGSSKENNTSAPSNSNTSTKKDVTTPTNKKAVASTSNTAPTNSTQKKKAGKNKKRNKKAAKNNVHFAEPIYTLTPNDVDEVNALRASQFIFDPKGVLSKSYDKWTKDDDDQEETNHKHSSKSKSKKHKSSHQSQPSTSDSARDTTTANPSTEISANSSIHASELNHYPVVFKKQYERMHPSNILQTVENICKKRLSDSQETNSPPKAKKSKTNKKN